MMKFHLHLKFIVLLMCANNAFAACDATQTTDMTQCAVADFQTADRQLNQAYSDYRTRLSASQKNQLKLAQLAWIKLRDLSCDFESSAAQGGSVYPMIRYECLAAKTKARLKEIRSLSACEEGDLRCPAPNPTHK